MALPAPYAPPWKRLGEDLVATLAWLGLKARELWRRNGEGSLPLPAWWPRRRARLFWPLALAIVLLGGVGLATLVGKGAPPAATPASQEGGRAEDSGAQANAEPEQESESEPVPVPVPVPVPEQVVTAEAGAEGEAMPRLDPLLERWRADDPQRLVDAISAEAANATLSLRLNDRFLALAVEERQDWAERWRRRAEELGYSHLLLVGAHQRLLGREAQVGSGMILFLPVAGPGPFR